METLGKEAHENGGIKIVEIPDDVERQIDDYDGVEWVAELSELHRLWSGFSCVARHLGRMVKCVRMSSILYRQQPESQSIRRPTGVVD